MTDQLVWLRFLFQRRQRLLVVQQSGLVHIGLSKGVYGRDPGDLVHRQAGQRVHPVTGDGGNVAVLQVLVGQMSRVLMGQLGAEGTPAFEFVFCEMTAATVGVITGM